MTNTFGPEVVAAIDAAWLRGDQQELVDYARRAAVFCTEETLARRPESALEWARVFEYIQRLRGDVLGRLLS